MFKTETATTKILGRTLCSYCGEEAKEHLGRRHHNEDDEYYCDCEGASKEVALQEEKSKLQSQLFALNRTSEDLLKRYEPTLKAKMYLIESAELLKKYNLVSKLKAGSYPTTKHNIDARIEQWHESNSPLPLHEFLDITREQYAFYVQTDELPLPTLIK